MNKSITLDEIRSAASILNQSGIFWAAFFMIGVPEETQESTEETSVFIDEIQPPFVSLSRFTPIPGTTMYDDVVEAGLLDPETTDWSWAVNQCMDRSFSKHISDSRMAEILKRMGDKVKIHNNLHGVSHGDRRLKLL